MSECTDGLKNAPYNDYQYDFTHAISEQVYNYYSSDTFVDQAHSGRFGINFPVPLPDGSVFEVGMNSTEESRNNYLQRIRSLNVSDFTEGWSVSQKQRVVVGDPLKAYIECIRAKSSGINCSFNTDAIATGRFSVTVSANVIDQDDPLPVVISVTSDPFVPVGDVVLKKDEKVRPAGVTQGYKWPAGLPLLAGKYIFLVNTTRGTHSETIEVEESKYISRKLDITFGMSQDSHSMTSFSVSDQEILCNTTSYFVSTNPLATEPALNERYGPYRMMVAVRVDGAGRISLATCSEHVGNNLIWSASFSKGFGEAQSNWCRVAVTTKD